MTDEPRQFVKPEHDDSGRIARAGDRASTIILLVASGIIAVGLAFAGLILVMSTDSCGSSSDVSCNYSLFTIAWLFSMATPLIGFLVTLFFTIRRLARSETAFWVPLAGTAGFFAAFALSVFVAFQAIG